MTVMAERTTHQDQMSVDDFEKLAKYAENEIEAVRFEFIDGRIGVKAVPDGDRREIIRWLQKQCMRAAGNLWAYAGDQGLQVEKYRGGRAQPDAVVAPEGTFAGQGDWAGPEHVALVVEVTSFDSDTHRRDRVEKPVAYAAAGIPAYLLIDRDACILTVYSEPSSGGYRVTRIAEFGENLALPEPVGIELDTEELKNYVR